MGTPFLVVIPTFEPKYTPNQNLEEYYRKNFASWLECEGDVQPFLLFSDFMSSEDYRVFLRKFAAEYPGRVGILEGDRVLSSTQAFNVAIQNHDYDIVLWAASDTRPRDRAWVTHFLNDFADPQVMAVVPTATEDGAACLPQTQSQAWDKPSYPIVLPRFFQLVVGAFRREMLEAFSHRLCDRLKDMGTEKGIMWQIEAVNGKALLSYNINIIHERYYEEGRYNWKSGDHVYRRDRSVECEYSKSVSCYLPTPGGWGRWQKPILEDLAEGWAQSKLRGVLRTAYIRWRRNNFFYIKNMMKMPYTNFIYENLIFRQQHKAFIGLDRDTRIALVQSLYMGDQDIYSKVSWKKN